MAVPKTLIHVAQQPYCPLHAVPLAWATTRVEASVDAVASEASWAAEAVAMTTARGPPPSAACSSRVSTESRYGTGPPPRGASVARSASAAIQLPKALSDVLIARSSRANC